MVVEIQTSCGEVALEPAFKQPRYDLTALSDVNVRTCFAQRFTEITEAQVLDYSSCERSVENMCATFYAAAADALPCRKVRPHRPWIQPATLDLIAKRDEARQAGRRTEEVKLNRQIRRTAKADRTKWLEGLITTGSWQEVKKLQQTSKVRVESRKLHDVAGNLVESSERADTFAAHLETVQWAVRPMNGLELRAPLSTAALPTCEGTITIEELTVAIRQLKTKKASVQVPAEFLKALLDAGAIDEGHWLMQVMRMCWETKTTPNQWHFAKVVPIYKKGNPASCDNYRPISLVSVLYKLYAKILLNRLKAAGAESRLWNRQFGFRSKRSTQDALFIVRRRVEQALASKDGRAFVLALDWRKAFDSISPERLLLALARFGLSESMLAAVGEIYSHRSFTVVDAGVESRSRTQHAGIRRVPTITVFVWDGDDCSDERCT